MTDELLLEVKDRIAYITLNRPAKRNALSPAMLEAFHHYLDAIDADGEARAVCIQAVGDKAFCSGADLGGGFHDSADPEAGGPRRYSLLLGRICGFGKPVVAKIAAPCLAGGLGLMTASHIVIAKSDVFFRLPEVNVGIFPFMVGALLYRNVLWKKAMEIALTGRTVGAAEAERIGLVSTVVEPEGFEAHVAEVLEGLAGRSPIGMRLGLEAFRALMDEHLDESLARLSRCLMESAATADAKEGIMAFLEKRKPNFSGK